MKYLLTMLFLFVPICVSAEPVSQEQWEETLGFTDAERLVVELEKLTDMSPPPSTPELRVSVGGSWEEDEGVSFSIYMVLYILVLITLGWLIHRMASK